MIIWVARTPDGIVEAASVAEYTAPETIKRWRETGRTPELVVADNVTLNALLPPDAEVFRSDSLTTATMGKGE